MPLTQPIIRKHSQKKSLSIAISMALALPAAQAATFNVTESFDNGTGLVANTLSWSILQANTTVGDDVIELNTDVTITGVMKRLIDSNTTLQSDATRRSIDGNSQFRPLFIKSGQVTIQGVDIQNGKGRGGFAGEGGSGGGFGGAVFIYDGDVSINDVVISDSYARGGGGYSQSTGGGGMFGAAASGCSGGGGLFEVCTSSDGAYGGYGNYQNSDADFGTGGNYDYNVDGTNGGFGAGGGASYYGNGGHGGFGGGGGYSEYSYGGDGGFGGGAGNSGFSLSGSPGFGGSNRWGASLGGALFIRTGDVSIKNSIFSENQAIEIATGEGLGGAIFVMHTTQNINGNDQSMPSVLPAVSGCGVVFNNNSAGTDPNTTNNNNDVFDLSNLITPDNGDSITNPCLPQNPEIQVTGNSVEILDGDITPDSTDFTAMGQTQISAQTTTRSFVISNQGGIPLTLTGNPSIELQNNAGQFSISSQPQSSLLNSNESVTFDVSFSPFVEGTDTATVVIQNNDADEAPYDFVIEAEGIAQAPVLQVLGNGIEIEAGDETPETIDNTDFGFTPVTGGMVTKTFEIKNIGFAPLNLADATLFQFNSDFTISQNITDSSLENGESTFVTVSLNPGSAGLSEFTALEVYDNNFNFLHYHVISGYGQPSLLINSSNNYIQEGDLAEFTVTTDVEINEFYDFNWQVNGQVNGQDFGGVLPSGSGFIDSFSNQFTIQFLTTQDGIYEGPEFFNVQLSTTDPRLALGFPSVSGGVIDDDLIYVDGFDALNLNQLIAAINKYTPEMEVFSYCDSYACSFLNRSMTMEFVTNNHALEALEWFEESLVMMQPAGDWDGDNLPNHHDLNPFGLTRKLVDKINTKL